MAGVKSTKTNAGCHRYLSKTAVETTVAVSVKDVCPYVPFPILVSQAKFTLFMGDQGIDKKPGKGGLNACGMFIFLPHCGNFGRFRNVGKQQPKVHPLGFRYFTRPISLPPLPPLGTSSEHSFTECLLQVWACGRHRGYGPCS